MLQAGIFYHVVIDYSNTQHSLGFSFLKDLAVFTLLQHAFTRPIVQSYFGRTCGSRQFHHHSRLAIHLALDGISHSCPGRAFGHLTGGIGFVGLGQERSIICLLLLLTAATTAPTQIIQNAVHDFFQIEGIKVQNSYLPGFGELATHLRPKFNAKFLDGGGIVFEGFYLLGERRRDAGFAKARHFDKSAVGIDAHQSRNNGTVNARGTTVLAKGQEHVRVKEHLGNNKICGTRKEINKQRTSGTAG